MAAQDTSGPGIRVDGAPDFDTSVAHPARIWDYFLGGKDNFAADGADGPRLQAEHERDRWARSMRGRNR